MEEPIVTEIRPVVESMGFKLLEVSVGRTRRLTHVRVVVYRDSGVGVEDCSAIFRVIRPWLETTDGQPDVVLEVSSPGIDRKLKSNEELAVFQGKGIRILVGDEPDWIGGIIREVDRNILTLEQGEGVKQIRIVDIRKARLDYTQEVVG